MSTALTDEEIANLAYYLDEDNKYYLPLESDPYLVVRNKISADVVLTLRVLDGSDFTDPENLEKKIKIYTYTYRELENAMNEVSQFK